MERSLVAIYNLSYYHPPCNRSINTKSTEDSETHEDKDAFDNARDSKFSVGSQKI